jgi:flagellar basal-body rod protein FlgF/flagellar basal-body rod protein FlgG
MATIAANLANVTTTGFKKDRVSFAAVMRGANQVEAARGINHARIQRIGMDFSQGGLQETGRQLDLAIEGEGFFKVRRGNEFFYTRAGHLQIDANGMVKTSEGLPLVDGGNQPLQLDTTAVRDIVIAESGEIALDGVRADGRIQVFAVNNAQQLMKAGTTLYRGGEGVTDQPLETTRVVQGSLETANVNMMEEMTAMVRTQRAFEVHHKAIESYAKLDEKLDELGTLG